MKILILFFSFILLLQSCNSLFNPDNVKGFIPGVYCTTWTTAFSEARDTLLIETITRQGSEGYIITRRTHVDFMNAAKKREPEYSIVKWTGTYDAINKIIQINNNGRVLSFDINKKEMKMGVVTYKKL